MSSEHAQSASEDLNANRVVTSRRRFLIHCSAVATVAAVPAGMGLCSPLRLREVSLDQISFGNFSRLVGTHFDVYQGMSPVRLELIEAIARQDHAVRRTGRRRDPGEFSLIFQGAKDQPLGQDSYPFTHEQIGRFVMFVVPVWDLVAVTGARFYEAVFNRSVGIETQML